jgi:hypothetical protein
MLRHLQHLRRLFQRDLIFRPLLRCKVGDIPVCAFGNAGERVSQISMWIDAPPPTTLDNCVDDGTALPGLGVSKKQPVLLADSRRPNGIFHSIVFDLPRFARPLGILWLASYASLRFDPAIADIFDERLPVRESVTDGLAKAARRKMPSGGNGIMARVGGTNRYLPVSDVGRSINLQAC